jgi:hypothetical protein
LALWQHDGAAQSRRSRNPAWKPVIASFEVQIDGNAIGDGTKDFYGVQPEPNGLYKNCTGAISRFRAVTVSGI